MPHKAQPPPAAQENQRSVQRWVCRCQSPPVLLATYDHHAVNIKSRDRYWHVTGAVRTVCPKCGAPHLLDLHDGNRVEVTV